MLPDHLREAQYVRQRNFLLTSLAWLAGRNTWSWASCPLPHSTSRAVNPKKFEFSQESLAGRRKGWGSGAACGGVCLLQNSLRLLRWPSCWDWHCRKTRLWWQQAKPWPACLVTPYLHARAQRMNFSAFHYPLESFNCLITGDWGWLIIVTRA